MCLEAEPRAGSAQGSVLHSGSPNVTPRPLSGLPFEGGPLTLERDSEGDKEVSVSSWEQHVFRWPGPACGHRLCLGGPGSNPVPHTPLRGWVTLGDSGPDQGLACPRHRVSARFLTPLWAKAFWEVYFLDGSPSLAGSVGPPAHGAPRSALSGNSSPLSVAEPQGGGPGGREAPESPAQPGLHPLALTARSC